MVKKIGRTALVLIFLFVALSYAQKDLMLYQKGSAKLKVIIERNIEISGNVNNAEIDIKTIAFRDAPGQKVLEQRAYAKLDNEIYEAKWQKDNYNNNFAFFTIGGIDLKNETKAITYKIEATIETNFTFFPNELYIQNGKFEEFTKPTKYMDSDNIAIKTLADNVFVEEDFNIVPKILNWVYNYLSYDISLGAKAYKASKVIELKKGTCDEFTNLAGALLKAKNIPVKFVEGIVYGSEGWQQHAWLLFYANDWYYAEPTFLQLINIDSLHIIQGIFKDYEESHDQFSYTQGIKIKMGKIKLNVEILNVKDFAKMLQIKQKEAKLFSNVPGSINFQIENLTQSYICTPITVSPSEEIKIFGDESFISCLKPKETLSKEIQLLATANVKENTYLQYTLFLQTLNKAKLEFKLYPSKTEGGHSGKFLSIKSISAYKKENKNIVEVVIENFSNSLQPIKFGFGQSIIEKEVAPNSEHSFTFTLPLNIKEVNFTIKAKDLNFRQTLFFPEIKTTKKSTEQQKIETVTKKGESKETEQKLRKMEFKFLFIVAGLFFIAVVIVLFKKFKSK